MSKITIINKLSNFLVPPATIAKPETKTLYAVVTGQYCGELLLFAEEVADDFCFISVLEERSHRQVKSYLLLLSVVEIRLLMALLHA